MRNTLYWGIMLCIVATATAFAEENGVFNQPRDHKIEGRYSGPWVTLKNKKLDGTTNCEVKQFTADKWQGRFWGEWQKVPFDYTVEFERVKNPPDRLETAQANSTKNVDLKKEPFGIPAAGKAMIDGASYEWAGSLSQEQFNIEFTGSRYEGHLELTQVPEKPEKKAGT